jgi:hypothetical protein
MYLLLIYLVCCPIENGNDIDGRKRYCCETVSSLAQAAPDRSLLLSARLGMIKIPNCVSVVQHFCTGYSHNEFAQRSCAGFLCKNPAQTPCRSLFDKARPQLLMDSYAIVYSINIELSQAQL